MGLYVRDHGYRVMDETRKGKARRHSLLQEKLRDNLGSDQSRCCGRIPVRAEDL
jgi:hypothetical protein